MIVRASIFHKQRFSHFSPKLQRLNRLWHFIDTLFFSFNTVITFNQKKFTGVGEVRIGDPVWSKIKFDVVFDTETQTADRIIYKVEK
jgi:hypothetical protein